MNLTPYLNKETKTLYLNNVTNYKYIINNEENLKDKPCNIYLTSISKEDLSIIESYKRASVESKKEIQDRFKHINLSNIIMLGNGNKKNTTHSKLEGLLEVFSKKDREKLSKNRFYKAVELFYRNYEKSREVWLEQSDFINMCPDVKMCWESALRKLGARNVHGLRNEYNPFYVVIWYDDVKFSKVKQTHNL